MSTSGTKNKTFQRANELVVTQPLACKCCCGALRSQRDRLNLVVMQCFISRRLDYALPLGPNNTGREIVDDTAQLFVILTQFKRKSRQTNLTIH